MSHLAGGPKGQGSLSPDQRAGWGHCGSGRGLKGRDGATRLANQESRTVGAR
jgi:hypothetical protein